MTENRLPTVEEINRRAYGLFIERGGQHGNDVQDWVKAEKELHSKSTVEQTKPKVAHPSRTTTAN